MAVSMMVHLLMLWHTLWLLIVERKVGSLPQFDRRGSGSQI
jgi:hypothetical protein